VKQTPTYAACTATYVACAGAHVGGARQHNEPVAVVRWIEISKRCPAACPYKLGSARRTMANCLIRIPFDPQTKKPYDYTTRAANCIRALSMDAVERAKSGHPGARDGHGGHRQVLGAISSSTTPAHPEWVDRIGRVLQRACFDAAVFGAVPHGYPCVLEEIRDVPTTGLAVCGHPEPKSASVSRRPPALGQGVAWPWDGAGGKNAGCPIQQAHFTSQPYTYVSPVTVA